MIKVLGRKTSGNVQKVLFALEELGVPYERQDYGRQFNNTQTPEYKALNPTSKVPTLVDGDVVIWESNSILRYLSDINSGKLNGSTPAQASEVGRWMDWLLASINPVYLTMFKDTKKPPEERISDFDAQLKDMISLLSLADQHLARTDWFALGHFTIADIAMGPIIKRCLEFPVEIPSLPNLQGWMKRIEERPAFQIALGTSPSKIATSS